VFEFARGVLQKEGKIDRAETRGGSSRNGVDGGKFPQRFGAQYKSTLRNNLRGKRIELESENGLSKNHLDENEEERVSEARFPSIASIRPQKGGGQTKGGASPHDDLRHERLYWLQQ